MNTPNPYINYQRQQAPPPVRTELMQAAQLARVAISPGHVLAGGVILVGGVWLFYKTFRGQIRSEKAAKKEEKDRSETVSLIETDSNAAAANDFYASMGMASNTDVVWKRAWGGDLQLATEGANKTTSFKEVARHYKNLVGDSILGYGDLNADLQIFFSAENYAKLKKIIQFNSQKSIQGLPIQLS